MNGDIGMAKYEKQVEQEAAYPIPISYNCYRTVRREKRCIATPGSVSHASHSCNSCTKIIGMGMQPLVPLVFHNLPSLYPLHLEERFFILVFISTVITF